VQSIYRFTVQSIYRFTVQSIYRFTVQSIYSAVDLWCSLFIVQLACPLRRRRASIYSTKGI
jgi:hypothetical protein